VFVEQAIFTSARTQRLDGYQLVAASPGVTEAEARELSAWGPTHDSLLGRDLRAASVNFHAMASGRMCVARSVLSGGEYSGRGGRKVYTQCLVVPAEGLARFANDPFRLLEAAAAAGRLGTHDTPPGELEPFALTGRAATIDQVLLSKLASEAGPRRMGLLVQAALDHPFLAVRVGRIGPAMDRLVAGLFNLLPAECRTEFSFTTGLKYSPRRPYRLFSLGNDPTQSLRLKRQEGVAVVDLAGDPSQSQPLGVWAVAVESLLRERRFTVLVEFFSQPRPGLKLHDLDELGAQILAKLGYRRPIAAASTLGRGASGAPSQRPGSNPATAVSPLVAALAPAMARGGSPPEYRLEEIDEVVRAAIEGNADALARLRPLWSTAVQSLPQADLVFAREKHLRRAMAAWRSSSQSPLARDPRQAIAALDVILVLFGGKKK
jgi:hypothetical protein